MWFVLRLHLVGIEGLALRLAPGPDGDGHLDPVGLAGGHAGRLVHLGPIAVLLVGPGIHESPGVGAGLFLQLRPDLALGGLAGIALYPGAEVRRPARDVQRAVGIADV